MLLSQLPRQEALIRLEQQLLHFKTLTVPPPTHEEMKAEEEIRKEYERRLLIPFQMERKPTEKSRADDIGGRQETFRVQYFE